MNYSKHLEDNLQTNFEPTKSYQTKDDGTRTTFGTGAQRSGKEGKGRYDLIPVEAKRREAIKYQQGAEIHGVRNWELGMPFSTFIDSAMRHLDQYNDGDTSEDHLAAAKWNLNALMHFEKWRPDLDDRVKRDAPPVQSEPCPPELPQYVGNNKAQLLYEKAVQEINKDRTKESEAKSKNWIA